PGVTFFLKKRLPNNKLLSNLHWPLFFAGMGNAPSATGITYSSTFTTPFILDKWIRGKYQHWLAKIPKSSYNYFLSVAVDSGFATSTIVIFFALVFSGVSLSWWGNNVL
ncbi:hypothetical protein EDB80DRAFT_535233, partial [Ilyonectria destructans]